MKSQESSSTTLYYSTSRGNFSSRGLNVQLHFCLNGREKYRRLLQSNSGNSTLVSADFLNGQDSFTRIRSEEREHGYENSESGTRASHILLLKEAQQRFLLAWTCLFVDPQPLIQWGVLWDGILHLIVECQPGTIRRIKGMSADCLVFFNGQSNGTPFNKSQVSLSPEMDFEIMESRALSRVTPARQASKP